VGELVIAEAMVTRNPDLQGFQLEKFDRAVHQLRRVTAELQDVAMSVRMIPLAATFQKMLRAVHDLAQREQKKVKLELIGEETEVDKTMAEKISDPLLHMVRNAVDHGLEPPEERLAAGKPETGTVTLEARHEGGEIWILIRDDGRGLDPKRILAKARERGLVAAEADPTEEEIYSLIFAPGFSTAETVSEVSGRGVGMDVAKKNIEQLKGRIAIQSRLGQGAIFTVKIPLTLAIIDGMLIRVGSSKYTIPLLAIRESLRPSRKMITTTHDGREFVRVRDDFIPIVRLHEVFSQSVSPPPLTEGILVIVEDQGHAAGLLVDEILGQHQAVVKGLSTYLGNARYLSGCTILGDGDVSLILDVRSLATTETFLLRDSPHPEQVTISSPRPTR
jgi:two-component system chemotaxis sensor kinase CheA